MASTHLVEPFVCQRCGHCCQGRGGIVLTPSDRQRLALHLGLAESEFLTTYTETMNGKAALRVGEDDLCVFFRAGCSVHEEKPAVCRAWPFFRGNLLDAISWEMAAEYCPGIDLAAGHEAFVRAGRALLQSAELFAAVDPQSPNALIPFDD